MKPTTTKEARAATPIAFVQAIVLAYERYGVNPCEALRMAHIAPRLLDRPTALITAAQMENISEAAMRELDDEALGWFSRKLPWGSYGMLCRASLSSPNLGVALRRWCRHHRLLTDDIVLTLEETGDLATLTIDVRRNLDLMHEFCLLTSLRYVHGFACWAIDSRIGLKEASFAFGAPAHHEVYDLLFPGPVRFGAQTTSLSFDGAYLALPLRRDEPALCAMLKRALPLTVLQYRRDRLLVQRVRELLQARPLDFANADRLSTALHLSARTLHRQLHDEGATLQGLKDEVRHRRAADLLCRTRSSVKQVALAVGFRNEKSFSRAFRQWTGEAPRAYRDKRDTTDSNPANIR